MVCRRDHAEKMVVVLGDGLPGPVLVHVAGLEVLEVPTEGPFVHGHGGRAYDLPLRPKKESSCRRSRCSPGSRRRKERRTSSWPPSSRSSTRSATSRARSCTS